MNKSLVDTLLDHHVPIEDWGECPLARLEELDRLVGSQRALLETTVRDRLIVKSTKVALDIRKRGRMFLVPESIVTAHGERALPDLGCTFWEEVGSGDLIDGALTSMLARIGVYPKTRELDFYCISEDSGEIRLSARYPGLLEERPSVGFVWEMPDEYFRKGYSVRSPKRTVRYSWFQPDF